jgi:UDP-N-acetylglucosamine 2-epimerase (non-hydrolysing)/GDP/UDP-N,N'-diacetylbacillosamine 2-epimerase (hydrolysing)
MERNKIKKFLFFFDSRATFSYSNNVIKIFKKKKLNYKILVSGNYLEKKMKIEKDIFEKNNLKVNYKVKFKSPTNIIGSWPKSFGKAMINYSTALSKIKPDLVILTGDRIETLCFCITASYMNIPIAHIQAGDKSGHIDDLARASIAKFSHLHFAPSIDACKRLESWGEEKKRIFFTGAPQLDDIHNQLENINNDYKKNFKDYFVVIFHPVLNELEVANKQVSNLLKAINKSKINVKWIYPNNDMGYEKICKKIIKNKNKNIEIIPNYERSEFLNILKNSRGIIGNSSSGIIEAPSLKIPVLNIGTRQNGRPQSLNIINSNYNYNEIIKKINYIRKSKNFSKSLEKIKNHFFVKKSSEKICRILKNLNKKSKLLQKY